MYPGFESHSPVSAQDAHLRSIQEEDTLFLLLPIVYLSTWHCMCIIPALSIVWNDNTVTKTIEINQIAGLQ